VESQAEDLAVARKFLSRADDVSEEELLRKLVFINDEVEDIAAAIAQHFSFTPSLERRILPGILSYWKDTPLLSLVDKCHKGDSSVIQQLFVQHYLLQTIKSIFSSWAMHEKDEDILADLRNSMILSGKWMDINTAS
jgi:hypothetical protein